MQRDDLVHPAHIQRDPSMWLSERPARTSQYSSCVLEKRRSVSRVEEGRTELKCPSSDVPPEKGVMGIEYLFAILTTFRTSSVLWKKQDEAPCDQAQAMVKRQTRRRTTTHLKAQTTTVGLFSSW